MQRTFFIYKLISPSGKVYIGQTYNVSKRFLDYKYIKKVTAQKLLSKELIEYGFDNFSKEVIYLDLTKSEADLKEIELISYYKSLNVSLNIAPGGDYYPNLDKAEILYKVNKLGEILEIFASVRECALKTKTSNAAIKVANRRKTFYVGGYFIIYKKLYDLGEFKQRKYGKGKLDSCIFQLNLNGNVIGTFENAAIASRITKISESSINLVISGKKKTAGKFIWVLERYFDSNKDYKIKKRKSNFKGKPINITNKETGEVILLDSLNEAVKYTGIPLSTISRILITTSNRIKNKYKYEFKYVK